MIHLGLQALAIRRRLIHQPYLPGFAIAVASLCSTTELQADNQELRNALSALEQHINDIGTGQELSANEIAVHKQTIDANSTIFGDRRGAINDSFSLVQTYEARFGGMWSDGSPTEQGYSRKNTSDGDIHWAVFNVMQYIVDDTYTPDNIANRRSTLEGFKFASADVVPGPVTPPSDPNLTHTVSIDASFLNTFGRNTMHWAEPDRNARKATGTYLAPGSIGTVTVPQELVNAGYKIRVGGQSWDFSNKDPIDRLDRVSMVYDITGTATEIASPLGGNIYIEVPFEAANGVVDVDFQNVVQSPFFSMQDHHETTLSDWQSTERNHAAPWTDLQSEKFMLTVPTGWVYAMDDPKSLLEDWDKAMDITNDLMGFPRDRGKATLYEAVDVRIRSGAYAPGYPTVNTTYDPLRNQDASGWNTAGNAYDGTNGNHLVQGPHITGSHVLFHEIGHAYLFPKLPGEVESVVNLLHVPVFHQGFGYDIDTAFRASRGSNNSYQTLDTTAITWMTSFNFFTRNAPMHQLEKQYQLKGHAKFVEYAKLFGWDKLGDYYRMYNEVDDVEGGRFNTGIDGHLLRLSIAAGKDITPLFHFWGIHPENIGSLRTELDAAGVADSREVYELLLHYKSLVPEDNDAFRQHALGWWGRQPRIEGYWTESEHARQWDDTDLSGDNPLELPDGDMYTEASAQLIRDVIDELLVDYYLPFLGDLNRDDTLDGIDWSIFIANAHTDMTGLTADEALALGDLDGDFDNDIDDFELFRQAVELVYPEPGAFEAITQGGSIPEPGTFALLLLGFFGTMRRHRRQDSCHT